MLSGWPAFGPAPAPPLEDHRALLGMAVAAGRAVPADRRVEYEVAVEDMFG